MISKKMVSLALLLAAATLSTLAAEPPAVVHELQPTKIWTAEDYAAARPLPLPTVRIDAQKVLDSRNAAPIERGPVQFHDGGPPNAASARDRREMLFDPTTRPPQAQPEELVSAKAFGTAGLLYTSSRVAPRATVAQFPFRMVGKLFFETPQGSFVCSAAVIDRRLVLTAGHCVHSGNGASSGFYSNFVFVPAYRDGEAPFGVWLPDSVIVSGGWFNGGGAVPAVDDFAIFTIADDTFGERIGDAVGRLGWQTESLCPNHVTMLGYPVNLDSGELMHQINTGDCLPFANNTVLAGSDMGGGSSGGPWAQNFGVRSTGQTFGFERGLNRVVGVTSFGPADDPDVLYQGSSILNSTFVSMYSQMCDAASGNC